MTARALGILVAGVASIAVAALAPSPLRAQPDRPLRAPSDFAGILEPAARSAALFVEAGRVLQHPRCLNCHPDGDRPFQGTGYPHQPPVLRGPDGHGVTTMRCATCHQRENFDPGRVPGHRKWGLAPLEMAWRNRSLAEICAQVKDRTRNGNLSVEQIVEHMADDSLVGWAWNPGAGREPAPGTQASFGALIKSWKESGAECPK
jgi:cytochrome c553